MESIKTILTAHTSNVDEKELQIKMQTFLSRYFLIELEVKSTDGKRRIDMVIVHKSDLQKAYPIGIEVKINEKKTGKDIAAWLKQANDYSFKKFIGYGQCLIVTCPQISGLYLREGELMHQHETDEGCKPDHNVSTFIGHFNIGEVQKYFRNGRGFLCIVFKSRIIWEQHNDIFRFDNYTFVCPKQ